MSDETTQSDRNDGDGRAGIAAQILKAIGTENGSALAAHALAVDDLLRCTRDQLLGFAKRLGVAGVSKLSKTDLATRLHALLAGHQRAGSNGDTHAKPAKTEMTTTIAAASAVALKETAPSGTDDTATGFPPKFDLGPDVEEEAMPRNIPWGYGQDRATAMVVDPDRLFVYWEVTDDAIARARRQLGPAGAGGWLILRVYDITGRLFDGTNAHSYFDHKIERGDRQWFFDINKPTSSACVEVGLKSSEGYFVKVARSGRVEFPRREPVGGGHVEWLTVTTASGPAAAPVAGGSPDPAATAASAPGWDDGSVQAGTPHGGGGTGGVERIAGGEHVTESRWEWREGEQSAWQSELASISWTEPVIRSTWEAGPFSYPVESPVFTEEHLGSTGQLHYRTENGRVHITYGPWQVVIRGLGARAERRVLATWQVTHTWSTVVARETTPTQWRRVAPGASEWMALGGSERVWMTGSELRLGGGSELFLLGASELRLMGASERMLTGASEYRFRGASERLAAGASEYRFRGASERLAAGASESRFSGASEMRLGGASERQIGGSEEHMGYPEATAAAGNGGTR